MKGVLHNGMSLFQDLKLKRRKVDSRCSSDGESIGTSDSTASLSPDAQNQHDGSPKNKERCTTPDQELVRSAIVNNNNNRPSSPSSQQTSSIQQKHHHHDKTFMVGMGNDHHVKQEGTTTTTKEKSIILNGSKITFSNSNNNNNNSTKLTNGVIKMTNEVAVTKQNGELPIFVVENGFATKKSRASSLEKMNQEEKAAAAAAAAAARKSPSAPPPQSSSSSSTTSSPSSSGNSSPPTMSHMSNTIGTTSSEKERVNVEGQRQQGVKMEVDNEIKEEESEEEKKKGSSSASADKKEDESSRSTTPKLQMKVEQNQQVSVGEKRKFSTMSSSSSSPGSPIPTSPSVNRNRLSPPGTGGVIGKITRSPPPIAAFLLGKRTSSGDSPPSSKSSSRVPSPQELLHLQQLHRQSSASSSPIHHQQHLSPQQAQLLLSQQSHLHARLLNGPSVNGPSSNHYPDSRIMLSSPSSLVQAELRTLTEKPDPLSVMTSTSLSFHHHSMYRINGVRPEIISGGAVTPSHPPPLNSNANSNNNSPHNSTSSGSMRKSPSSTLSNRSPNSSPRSNASSSGGSSGPNHLHNGSIHSPQNGSLLNSSSSLAMMNSLSSGQSGSSNSSNSGNGHVNLSRTPTVIMGEAGGVRTMLWSQPGGQTISSDMPPSLQQSNTTSMTNGHFGQPSSSPHHGMSNGHSNSSSPPSLQHQSSSISAHLKGGLSMERLWASEALNLSTGGNSGGSSNGYGSSSNGAGRNSDFSRNNHHQPNGSIPIPILGQNGIHHQNGGGNSSLHPEDEDYEQPMICMICEDRATGLHYGIITCEGCKGFFKRTVQNRRVYTCVADGTCEITKAQRNRCQYCRFKKCIEQGMVLQAVREDRMPGGRNSGAVYNLYKVPVKYRKHKKGNRAGGKMDKGSNVPTLLGSNNNSNSSNGLIPSSPGPSPLPQSITGTILKAALTNPNEIHHLRPAAVTFEQAAAMITNLVQCDNVHDIAALQNWEELLEGRGDLSEKLCQMGDSIVYRLVQWTKRLPFYQEVPVDVHTRILTHKWHELLVLTTSAWQAMHTPGPPSDMTIEEEAMENLHILQRCLQAMMGRSLTIEQLRQDVGQMVERLTYLTRSFRRLGIRLEEYVTLKVIAMLQNTGSKSSEVGVIQERYIRCLGTFLEVRCPSHKDRLRELLQTLPEVQAAAALLLESKMFYVPFLLNSALQR